MFRNPFCACNTLSCEIRCRTSDQEMPAPRLPLLELRQELRHKLRALLLLEGVDPFQARHLRSPLDLLQQAVAMRLLSEMPWWRCPPHPSYYPQFLDQGASHPTLLRTPQVSVQQLQL